MIIDLKNALSHSAMAPAKNQGANFNSSVIDLQQYQGVVLVVVNAGVGSGTSPTLDVVLHAGAESNGANSAAINVNATQVANANSLQVLAVDTRSLNGAAGRYLKAVCTIGGTNTPIIHCGLSFHGRKKHQ